MENHQLVRKAKQAQIAGNKDGGDVVIYARSKYGIIWITADENGLTVTVQRQNPEEYLVGFNEWKSDEALNLYDSSGEFNEGAEIPEVGRDTFYRTFPDAEWEITSDSPVK